MEAHQGGSYIWRQAGGTVYSGYEGQVQKSHQAGALDHEKSQVSSKTDQVSQGIRWDNQIRATVGMF